jgi:Fe2+ transport system protein FeoA
MDAHAVGVGTFPLVLASEGERVRIVAYAGGREFTHRMIDLGLPIGSEVTIVQRQRRGPMVVARDDVRLGIAAGMAHRVLVAVADGR